MREGGTLTPNDEKVLNPSMSGEDMSGDEVLVAMPQEGMVQITGPEQLMELAKMARETYDAFSECVGMQMTMGRARAVRRWRVDESCSWRAVAFKTHEAWGDDAAWTPPDNQLAGMALCEAAAKLHGENHEKLPWN